MDFNYYNKIQNTYGAKSKRECLLYQANTQMEKHFYDTYDTETVLLDGIETQVMIIKDSNEAPYRKKIKTPHNVQFKLGDYIFYNDQWWIVTNVDVDRKTWNRGYISLCNVLLSWQNEHGEIIQRWGYLQDQTKYSTGEKGNSVVVVADNQYGVTLPIDSETKRIKRDMRFVIDINDVTPPDVYRVTGRKAKLKDYTYFDQGATVYITLSFDAFDYTTDKYIDVGNGNYVWICDYVDISNQSNDNIEGSIIGSNKLKVGIPKQFVGKMSHPDTAYKWNINTHILPQDFSFIQIDNNTVELIVENESLVGEMLTLQILVNGNVITEKQVEVVNGF